MCVARIEKLLRLKVCKYPANVDALTYPIVVSLTSCWPMTSSQRTQVTQDSPGSLTSLQIP